MASGSGGGSPLSFNTSFTDVNQGLFGNDSNTNQNQSGEESSNIREIGSSFGISNRVGSGKSVEQLKVDREGLLKLIDDSLKGVDGIAEIFGLEKGSGLFKSSGARQGTEDLLAKIAGELALVTGKKTINTIEDETSRDDVSQSKLSAGDKTFSSSSKSKTRGDGLVDKVLGIFDF